MSIPANIDFKYVYNDHVFRDYDENKDWDRDPSIPDMDDGESIDPGSVKFTCGSLAELNQMVRFIALVGPQNESGTMKRVIEVYSGSAFIGNSPGITPGEGDDYYCEDGKIMTLSETQEELLQIALRLNCPMGECSVYNDNYNDARPIALRFTLDEPSMHERAEARNCLRQLLAAHVAKEDLGRLIPEG